MNKTLIKMLFTESDPYYSRELIGVVLGFIVINLFSPYGYYPSAFGYYVGSIAAGCFIAALAYSSLVAGSFARSIERGSLGYLMTMPVNRRILLPLYITMSVIPAALIFSIPMITVNYLVYVHINLTALFFTFVLMLVSLIIFTSVGYLIASVTSNSILTVMFTFAIFFVLGVYDSKIFPKNHFGQFLISGFLYFTTHFSVPPDFELGFLILAIIGIALSFIMYPIIHAIGLRSGR